MTGEIQPIWEAGNDNGVVVGSKPYLSPDNYYIAFYVGVDQFDFGSQTLQIIDRNGPSTAHMQTASYSTGPPGAGFGGDTGIGRWTKPACLLAACQCGRGLVPLCWPRDFRFVSGQWSGDGRYFIYNALDDSIGASYLYLWQPESGIPQLIHSTASTSPSTPSPGCQMGAKLAIRN